MEKGRVTFIVGIALYLWVLVAFLGCDLPTTSTSFTPELSPSVSITPTPTPEPLKLPTPTPEPREPPTPPEPPTPTPEPPPEPSPSPIVSCEPKLELIKGCYSFQNAHASISTSGEGSFHAFLMTKDEFMYEIKSERKWTGNCFEDSKIQLEFPYEKLAVFVVTVHIVSGPQLAYIELGECR